MIGFYFICNTIMCRPTPFKSNFIFCPWQIISLRSFVSWSLKYFIQVSRLRKRNFKRYILPVITLSTTVSTLVAVTAFPNQMPVSGFDGFPYNCISRAPLRDAWLSLKSFPDFLFSSSGPSTFATRPFPPCASPTLISAPLLISFVWMNK